MLLFLLALNVAIVAVWLYGNRHNISSIFKRINQRLSNQVKYTFGTFYSAIDESLILFYGSFAYSTTINNGSSYTWNSTNMNSGLTISSGLSSGTISATNLTLSNTQQSISFTRLMEMDQEIKDLKQEISNLQVAMKMRSMNGEKIK